MNDQGEQPDEEPKEPVEGEPEPVAEDETTGVDASSLVGVEDPDTVETDDEAVTDEPTPAEDKPSRGVGAVGWVAFAVALLLGLSGGAAWWTTHRSNDLSLAHERDAVRIAATRDIGILNTLDYREIAEGLQGWRAVSTGTLRDQFGTITAKDQQSLAAAKKITSGQVIDAAVVDLDPDGGSATILAAVEVTVRDGSDASADPVVKRNRFSAEMTRSGGQWKVSNLQQVAVNVS